MENYVTHVTTSLNEPFYANAVWKISGIGPN